MRCVLSQEPAFTRHMLPQPWRDSRNESILHANWGKARFPLLIPCPDPPLCGILAVPPRIKHVLWKEPDGNPYNHRRIRFHTSTPTPSPSLGGARVSASASTSLLRDQSQLRSCRSLAKHVISSSLSFCTYIWNPLIQQLSDCLSCARHNLQCWGYNTA